MPAEGQHAELQHPYACTITNQRSAKTSAVNKDTSEPDEKFHQHVKPKLATTWKTNEVPGLKHAQVNTREYKCETVSNVGPRPYQSVTVFPYNIVPLVAEQRKLGATERSRRQSEHIAACGHGDTEEPTREREPETATNLVRHIEDTKNETFGPPTECRNQYEYDNKNAKPQLR